MLKILQQFHFVVVILEGNCFFVTFLVFFHLNYFGQKLPKKPSLLAKHCFVLKKSRQLSALRAAIKIYIIPLKITSILYKIIALYYGKIQYYYFLAAYFFSRCLATPPSLRRCRCLLLRLLLWEGLLLGVGVGGPGPVARPPMLGLIRIRCHDH